MPWVIEQVHALVAPLHIQQSTAHVVQHIKRQLHTHQAADGQATQDLRPAGHM
jgi:hypothetical protein